VTPIVCVFASGASLSFAPRSLKVAAGFAKPPFPLERFPEAADVIRFSSLVIWLVFAGLGLLLVALRLRGRIPASAFAVLAVLLVVADLFKAGMGFNPAVEQADADPPPTQAIRVLERNRSARFVSVTLFDIPANVIPMRYDLLDARGYDVPIVERYDRLWRTQLEPECPTQTSFTLLGPFCLRLYLANVTPTALNALRTLGVGAILQPPTQEALDLPGVTLAYSGPDARIYAIAGARRAFVAGAQQVVADGDEALHTVAQPGFSDRAVAVTEHRLRGVPEVAASAQAPLGPARIVTDDPQRVVVRARSTRPGVLVLTDTYFPGWKAKLDGRDVPIEQVNYTLRGVPIGAGTHVVEFRYRPLSWRIGWITSLLALIGLAAALTVGLLRRRRHHAE
jgi:hypothetical protein